MVGKESGRRRVLSMQIDAEGLSNIKKVCFFFVLFKLLLVCYIMFCFLLIKFKFRESRVYWMVSLFIFALIFVIW